MMLFICTILVQTITVASYIGFLLPVVAGQSLQTLPVYDELLRQANQPLERDANLLKINETLRICHIVDMNIHSWFRQGDPQRINFDPTTLQTVAAQALALEHLNTGNGVVVKEVEDLDQRCNIKFTGEFMDTEGSSKVSVDRLTNILSRTLEDENNAEPPPCAFMGAFSSQVSMSTALLTSLNNYPQFSGFSQASQLDDKALFPLFGRFVPSNDNYAQPLVDFLVDKLNVRHLVVAFSDDSRSISFTNGLREAAAPRLKIHTVGFSDGATNYAATIQGLKETGFRFILAVCRYVHIQPLMVEAYREQIAGNGKYNWIITPGMGLSNNQYPQNSTFAKSLKGVMEFTLAGALPGIGRYNEFQQSWQQLAEQEDDLRYLSSKLPKYENATEYNPTIDKSTFNPTLYTDNVGLRYDIVIALGLAACAAASETRQDNATTTTTTTVPLLGEQHYKEVLQSSFIGASGRIQLDPATGSRNANSALFKISNYVPTQEANGVNVITFQDVNTHQYNGEDWVELVKIQFNDGTESIPPDLPPPEMEYNYIGTALRATGLAMSAVALLLSMGFSLWTYWNKSKRVVKSSQPLFLQLICLGSFFMASSIIPLSIDDEIASESGATIACMSVPWLLSLGWCFAFSALFTKTRRTNKVFHNPSFRRITVSPRSVIRPMVGMLAANILVLILWTTISPLYWEREVIDFDVYGRPKESAGKCEFDDRTVTFLFLGLILVINVGVLLMSAQQAFVARRISTEYSESEWIGRCISIILIVILLAGPADVIARQGKTRSDSFVLALIVFVVCISLLGFIFVPKIALHHGRSKIQKENGASIISGFFKSTPASPNDNTTTNPSDVDLAIPEGSEVGGHCGVMVLEHPKFRQYMENQIRSLRAENESLKRRLAVASGDNKEAASDGT